MTVAFHVTAQRVGETGTNIVRYVEATTIHNAISLVQQDVYRQHGADWEVVKAERVLRKTTDSAEGVPAG